jgi:hypothetical protein
VVQHLVVVRDVKVLVIGHGGIDVGRDDRDTISHPNSVSG